MKNCSRREFLRASALSSAALLTAPSRLAHAPQRTIPIGVQLYSVRSVFNNDVPGTLAGIKKIGYQAVEFAGYANYANDAKGLRQLLDDNGLKACGTHLPGALGDVTGDNLDKTIEFNEVLGNNKLIVAHISATTPDDWEKQADIFSGIAEKLKPRHMRIGYHNHTAEFTPLPDGRLIEDIFFGKASPDVFIQLDIGHCAHAGADPVAFIKKHAGRILSVHVKDWVPDTKGDILGAEGAIVKWPEVLAACQPENGPQWLIIEEESGKYDLLKGIELDFQNLAKLLPT